MPQQKAGRVFILGLLVLSGYLLYVILKPFLTAFSWAAFLAIPFYPVHLRLKRILRGRTTLAALGTTLIITVLILVPIVVLVSSLAGAILSNLPAIQQTLASAASPTSSAAGEVPGTIAGPPEGGSAAGHKGPTPSSPATAGEGASSAPGTAKAGQGAAPAKRTQRRFPMLAWAEQKLSPYVDLSGFDLQGKALSAVEGLGTFMINMSRSFLGNALSVLSTFLVTMVMLAVLFVKGPDLIGFLRKFIPLSREDQDAVFGEMSDMTRAIFYGVIMTAAIQGTVGGIGWKIAGLPSPIIFGVGMFFCALLPVGGAAIVWAPGAIWLLWNGRTGAGIFLIVWGVLAVSMLDNVLRPIFISGKTRAPIIPVMLGIFGGIAAFGMTGLFTGPLIITVFLFVLDVIRREFFPAESARPAGAPAGTPAPPGSAAPPASSPPPGSPPSAPAG